MKLLLPQSPEGKIAWIVVWMLLGFAAVFYILARVPARYFNRLFE